MNESEPLRIRPVQRPLLGTTELPSDKSIAHRRLLIASVNNYTNHIQICFPSIDVKSTLFAIQKLGIPLEIQTVGNEWHVTIPMKKNFRADLIQIDCGNSGTTTRLLCGLLAGNQVNVELIGDESLSKRPMKRVVEPLQQMSALIELTQGNLPIRISPSQLRGIDYELSVASAQVKSAILLAGCFADGNTIVREKTLTRDHTERLLQLTNQGDEHHRILCSSADILFPDCSGFVPYDVSNLAYWIAAALLINDSHFIWENVLLNPTRTRYLELIQSQGANVQWNVEGTHLGEPLGMVEVYSGGTFSFDIEANDVPLVIDEIPILAILAAASQGSFRVRSANELRHKESDRIRSVVTNLRLMNVDVEEYDDGFSFDVKQTLRGAIIDSFMDHRIAMSFAIASLVAQGETILKNAECASVSDPVFMRQFVSLTQE